MSKDAPVTAVTERAPEMISKEPDSESTVRAEPVASGLAKLALDKGLTPSVSNSASSATLVEDGATRTTFGPQAVHPPPQ